VRANVTALTQGSAGTYVIGTGKKTSVNEIYRAMVEATGFEAPVTHAERRPGDAREVYFNPAKAKRELGWEAQVPLVEGMRKTYEYFRDREKLTTPI
jgi:UDP-glucose 4-epimerase